MLRDLCELLVTLHATRRRLYVIGCASAIAIRWCGEFRPDRLPVVGAKHLPRDAAFGGLLDRGTVLDGHFAAGRHPLMDRTFRDAEDVSERFEAADYLCSDCDGMLFHGCRRS